MSDPERKNAEDATPTNRRTSSRVGDKRFQSTLPGVARTPAFAEAEEARRSSLLPPADDARGALSDPPWSDPPPQHFEDDDGPSTYPDRCSPVPAEVMAAGLSEGDRMSGEYRIAHSDDDVRRQHADRYLRRGRRALDTGDRQAALKYFQRALLKDPDHPEAKAALAEARHGD